LGTYEKLHIFQKQTYVCFTHQKCLAHFAYLQGLSLSLSCFSYFSIHCKFAPSPAMSVKAWQVNCALEHRVYRVSKNISWYNSYHIWVLKPLSYDMILSSTKE
jgi:hypothetical protein